MTFKIQKHLSDIQTSTGSIYESLGEQRNFDVYLANKRQLRSVMRKLETVCEAVSGLLQLNPDIRISNARKVVSLCNCIIHSDSADSEIVREIVVNYLPKLKEEVDKLLAKS